MDKFICTNAGCQKRPYSPCNWLHYDYRNNRTIILQATKHYKLPNTITDALIHHTQKEKKHPIPQTKK